MPPEKLVESTVGYIGELETSRKRPLAKAMDEAGGKELLEKVSQDDDQNPLPSR